MPFIRVTVPRTSQPQHAVPIDWSKPITRGLSAVLQADGFEPVGKTLAGITGAKATPSTRGVARGFGSTYGAGGADVVTTQFTGYAAAHTVVIPYLCHGSGGGGFGRLLFKGTDATNYAETVLYTSGHLEIGFRGTSVSQYIAAPLGALDVPHVFAYSTDGVTAGSPPASGVAAYLDGVAQTLSAPSLASGLVDGQTGRPYYIGNRYESGTLVRAWDGWIGSIPLWSRVLSPGEVASISANVWQIYEDEELWIYVPVSSGTSGIAASGAAQAGGSAAASAQVALAAIGVVTAGGQATAGVSVPLAAAGLAVAGGQAAAVATITVAAAGLAQAAGQAGLAAGVLTAASGAAQAAGNAALAAQLAALASGGAAGGGSATLSGGAPGSIAANGGAQASGSAVLAISFALAALGGAEAAGAAPLTATVQISAAGFVQAMGAGSLVVNLPLTAFAAAQAGGSAGLTQIAAGAAPVMLHLAAGVSRRCTLLAGATRATRITAAAAKAAHLITEARRVGL